MIYSIEKLKIKEVTKMSEIDQLIKFMLSGNRKKIRLSEYMVLQTRKGLWNKGRAIKLRREISLTNRLNISYIQNKERKCFHTETVLSLENISCDRIS